MDRDVINNLQSARDRLVPKVTACWGDAFDGDFDSMLDAINAMKRYAANIGQDRAAFRELAAQRDEAVRLLGLMYDKYENGDPCYDDEMYLGPAFRLSESDEQEIITALNAGAAIANATQQRKEPGA